jgi:hypothetical protein
LPLHATQIPSPMLWLTADYVMSADILREQRPASRCW